MVRNYLVKLIPNADIYIDQKKSKGTEWQKENDTALKNSDLVIAILTPGGLASNEVEREIKIAKEKRIRILPCLDEKSRIKMEDIPWGLSDIDGIKFNDIEVLLTNLFSEVGKIIIDCFKKQIIPKTTENMDDYTPKKDGELPVIYGNKIYMLDYSTKIGLISSISGSMHSDTLSLNILITCQGKVNVDISLPRNLIDSKLGSNDNEFVVLDNGKDVKVDMKNNQRERIISLPLENGIHSVEIVGNQLLGIRRVGISNPKNIIKMIPGSALPDAKCFEPEIILIKMGETVRVENLSSAAHTFTAGDPKVGPTREFDSGLVMPGRAYEVSLNRKGKINYFCMVHPWERGVIEINNKLTCKSCGEKINSPVSAPAGSIKGPPGAMTTNCPKCGNKVDILYD